jgi:hypothetical protein
VGFCFSDAFPAARLVVARVDELLEAQLKTLGAKPADAAKQADKKRYSERISEVVALALGQELRYRGMREARPATPGELDISGAERRMAGGIGAKKVDVTWATEESGLLLGISVKSINFSDKRTNNFQKNLTNRRGDMLMEAVTLHRRFPYAVLIGLFLLDQGAEHDHTRKRRSTFINAHARMRLFTGRSDPAGRDEQYERLYLILLDASRPRVSLRAFEVGKPEEEVPMDGIMDTLVELVAERNPDFYEVVNGKLISVNA